MLVGISTSRNCETLAGCLGGRVDFVVRYHSARTRIAGKRLAPREAATLARAGIHLVTVYQDRARQPEDFGAARGHEDGRAACTLAAQVGQPAGSAIYFAVDTDFSDTEVGALVLPYFEGVRTALAEAAADYRVGVYGSGLVCQRVKHDAALATLSWLAMAGGWRGSAGYGGWDLQQRAATDTLCGLGPDGRETVHAAADDYDAFGAFMPIGADVRAGGGELRRVTASQLFLRRVPSRAGNTPIARLPEGQIVHLLGAAAPPFVRVRTTLGGSDVIGYASAQYLAPLGPAPAAPPAPPAPTPLTTGRPTPPAPTPPVPAVHYREHDPQSRRDSTARRAQPLGEPQQPWRDPEADFTTRLALLAQIVAWLDVERSARYAPAQGKTYCNVYAADYSYLARAYLPRVWWQDSALLRWGRGETLGAEYGRTVREMRADDLLAWLIGFGPNYGWRRVFDASALQAAADAGGVGLICADRDAPGLPGHITVVVPETPTTRARRDADGHVVMPVQSEAGRRNRARHVAARPWWDDPAKFRDFGFFVHA
jgi:hypothetical protein